MTGFAGRSEFFSREAGDYLRELDPLLSGASPPPGDAIVRLTRALRGAAMLAGPASYTRAARQLEQVAKLVQEGRIAWGTAAPVVRDALADFHRLTGFAQAWDGDRDKEAEGLEGRLQALQAPSEAPQGAPPHPPAEDGLRAFVAREVLALAGVVTGAATTVAAGSGDAPASIAAARAAMRSLQGLAGLADLSPLGDVLDVLDHVLADLDRHPTVPPGAARILALSGSALGQLAGDITRHGRPRDLAGVEQLVEAIHEGFVLGDGTVPMDDLLLPGAERPLPGPTPSPAGAMDLASLGERLRFGSAQLRAAPNPLSAALRAYTLLAAIRSAPGGLGQEPAGAFLARLAGCLEQRGAAEDAVLVALIDQAGEHLSSRSDHRTLSLALGALAARLPDPAAIVSIEALAPASVEEDIVPIEVLAPEVTEEEIVPIEVLAPEITEEEIVPIEALAPESVEEAIVPIEALAPEVTEEEIVPIQALAPGVEPTLPPSPLPAAVAPADRTRLERTLSTYSRLVATHAPVLPIEALIPPAVAPLQPRGSRSAAIEIEAELDVIPIESLLYSGDGALARADDVRRQLEAALRMASDEMDRVEPLVRELLDLVPLAVTNGR